MEVAIPLDKVTIAEKLNALDQIWDDLQRTAEKVPSPAWHEDVLRAREARMQSGASRFGEWTKAKGRIRERVKCITKLKPTS